MTLIERVQRLRVAAVAVEDEEKIKRRTGALASHAETVEATIDTIRRLSDGLAELRAVGVTMSPDLLVQATQVAGTLDALSKKLPGQDANAPLDEPKVHIKTAESLVKTLRRFVEEGWAAERTRTVPVINEDLVVTLGKSGIDVEEISDKIEKAYGELEVLDNRPVPELGDVARLAAARETLRACGQQITELVDPILTGVIMDAQGAIGTPLSAFTPEVLAGLAKLGILDRFWVRLR